MKSSRLGIATLLGAACLLALSAGCVKKKKYNEVKAERDAAIAEKEALANTVQMQDQQLAALEEDFNELTVLFEQELARKELQLKKVVEGISVAIPADIMYESGEAKPTVGSAGVAYAERLAQFLNENEHLFVSVVGHTDNEQPTPQLQKKYPTNWHLGAARAAGAVNYLASQGVSTNRMVASSRGESDPVASNDTAEGRAQNRRIEIILRKLPK